VNRRCATT